ATWLGVVFAYDSYYWFPSRRGLPVSFFVVMVVVVEFIVVNLARIIFSRRVTSPRTSTQTPCSASRA
ncbi:MAG TPA: hypothetical protein VII65_05225, partial [Acidimicrobiales bacterium]